MSPGPLPAAGAAPATRASAAEVDSLVGMTILLGAWVMLFAALFLAYGVVRVQASEWPPFGAPRLPRGLPALNTLLLVASSLVLRRGLARARRGDARALPRGLAAALALGLAFLVAQIALWKILIGRDLLPSSGVYGSVLFAFTGFHALHVLGGLLVLAWLALRARASAIGDSLGAPDDRALHRTKALARDQSPVPSPVLGGRLGRGQALRAATRDEGRLSQGLPSPPPSPSGLGEGAGFPRTGRFLDRRAGCDARAPERAARLAALYWDFVAAIWVLMYLTIFCL